MKIYFDNCCLNRPFDDLNDYIVRMEYEAILSIIDICESGRWQFFSSDVLLSEISGIIDNDKYEKVMLIYNSAGPHITLTDEIVARAKVLELQGIKPYDALHLASAEAGGAGVFLTTDYKLLKKASKIKLNVPVKNPVIWLAEVFYDRES